jgi:type VI secretion system secreted protein Hcp
MATDFFLKLDGVKGESVDDTHAGEIEVESFSWGQTNATTIGSATGGAGAGKVKFDSAVFTTRVSSASPLIAGLCASGTHLKNAVFTARKAGGKQEGYYKVTFHTVFFTSLKTIAAVGTDVIPREEITFVFGKYEIEYRPQGRDGALGTGLKSGWDQITNKKV